MPPETDNPKSAKVPRRKRNWRGLFIEKLKETRAVGRACQLSGISRATYLLEYNANPEFRTACYYAKLDAGDDLIATTHQRCLHGDITVKFDREGQPYYERSFPNALIAKLLEAYDPELFHRNAVDHAPDDTGKGGVIYLPPLEDKPQ